MGRAICLNRYEKAVSPLAAVTHGGNWLGLRKLTSNVVPRCIAEQLLNQRDLDWRKYEQHRKIIDDR
jgi:hypothetical protein